MADLGSELLLPLVGDLRAGAGPLIRVKGLMRLIQLLGNTGLKGLQARQQGGL